MFASQNPEMIRALLTGWRKAREKEKAALAEMPLDDLESALLVLDAARKLALLPREMRDILYVMWLDLSAILMKMDITGNGM